MTQYQQVLTAVRTLGKGTPKEIYDKIKETNPEWGTRTPIASVSSYLSINTVFKNENKVWSLREEPVARDDDDTSLPAKKTAHKSQERGLYFITLSPYIKILGAGFLFKIGKSDDTRSRLTGYSAALPIDTIQMISFYSIPSAVDLAEAEKEVNGELLGNSELGSNVFGHVITVRPYFGNHQREWLQTLDIAFSDEEGINKLAKVVDAIVKNTIEALTPVSVEDPVDE
jgi:hypothetical protein